MYRKGDMEMGKQTAWEEIDKKSSEIFTASDEIWGCAETAFTEEKSMKILCDVLKAEGFTVETGLAGVTTAFKGTFGSGKPVIVLRRVRCPVRTGSGSGSYREDRCA